ncbi:MAG TPA: NAD-dependent epimerase/dehydratase family protein [Candidatus Tumulicola sp.]|jgi:nucleoside-diphosphate-sugar epimerase
MRLLILSGTGWLGGRIAEAAIARGYAVTCLARGVSGAVPPGASFVQADRSDARAFESVARDAWDTVVDISSLPAYVRAASSALVGRARTYTYVSSASVYADDTVAGQDETAPLVAPGDGDDPRDVESYGPRKVACERAVVEIFGVERSLIVRPGLIGGPGDRSDRSGYWPLRFARPAASDGSVLVPDEPGLLTELIDVRDLALWIASAAETATSGTYNAFGESFSLAHHLEVARLVAGHAGPIVAASSAWLEAHGVQPWMGERSLPLWLPGPEYAGFGARDDSAARSRGLRNRPLDETLADTLAWELTRDSSQPRHAGLSNPDERTLLQELSLSS